MFEYVSSYIMNRRNPNTSESPTISIQESELCILSTANKA